MCPGTPNTHLAAALDALYITSQVPVKEWVQEKVDAEVARVVGLGQRVIKLPVKNCSIVRQTKDVVNRVEVCSLAATAF